MPNILVKTVDNTTYALSLPNALGGGLITHTCSGSAAGAQTYAANAEIVYPEGSIQNPVDFFSTCYEVESDESTVCVGSAKTVDNTGVYFMDLTLGTGSNKLGISTPAGNNVITEVELLSADGTVLASSSSNSGSSSITLPDNTSNTYDQTSYVIYTATASTPATARITYTPVTNENLVTFTAVLQADSLAASDETSIVSIPIAKAGTLIGNNCVINFTNLKTNETTTRTLGTEENSATVQLTSGLYSITATNQTNSSTAVVAATTSFGYTNPVDVNGIPCDDYSNYTESFDSNNTSTLFVDLSTINRRNNSGNNKLVNIKILPSHTFEFKIVDGNASDGVIWEYLLGANSNNCFVSYDEGLGHGEFNIGGTTISTETNIPKGGERTFVGLPTGQYSLSMTAFSNHAVINNTLVQYDTLCTLVKKTNTGTTVIGTDSTMLNVAATFNFTINEPATLILSLTYKYIAHPEE